MLLLLLRLLLLVLLLFFSQRACVAVNSDTLNNAAGDIESCCVSATLPLTLREGGSSGDGSPYKKNNQSGLMELISSGLLMHSAASSSLLQKHTHVHMIMPPLPLPPPVSVSPLHTLPRSPAPPSSSSLIRFSSLPFALRSRFVSVHDSFCSISSKVSRFVHPLLFSSLSLLHLLFRPLSLPPKKAIVIHGGNPSEQIFSEHFMYKHG